MARYDILNLGWAVERAAGKGAQELREGLYRIVGRGEEEPGKQTDYTLQGVEEVKEETVVLGDIELRNCVLTASMTNQVVKTAINGMAGTVKEWVSNGDVAIGLTVTLLTEGSNEYPWGAVEALMKVLGKDEALEIESRWLNDVWGVTRVVVESYHLTGHTERNYEVVEVSLASDKEYLIAEEVEA